MNEYSKEELKLVIKRSLVDRNLEEKIDDYVEEYIKEYSNQENSKYLNLKQELEEFITYLEQILDTQIKDLVLLINTYNNNYQELLIKKVKKRL